jgi:Ca2+-binding RTX toxin-like protein
MRTTRLTSICGAICVMASIGLGAPSAAVSAGTVALEGDRLVLDAYGGNNRLQIRRHRPTRQIRIDELHPRQSLVAADARCSAEAIVDGGTRVVCPASGIRKLIVSTRGGNDRTGVGGFFEGWTPSHGERSDCDHSAVGAALSVSTGAGRDVAEMGRGADVARGGPGVDLLMGCAGDDRIKGGPDRDYLSGDRGNDRLHGLGGKDTVVGCLYQPNDTNYPSPERGDDRLHGGVGSDYLFGCLGRDHFLAGAGADTLQAVDDPADKRGEALRCGPGNDVITHHRDSPRGCEVATRCLTDQFPIRPDRGIDSECFTYLRHRESRLAQ